MKSARVQTSLLLVAVVLATIFASSDAYGNGAPVSACETATPGHLNSGNASDPILPQTGDIPYSFTFDVQEYVRGGEVQVTIEGTFQGFLLQARRVSDGVDGVPVGTFTAPDTSIGQLLDCTSSSSTVTHTNPNDKTNQTFTWQVPDAGTGNVHFYGTVATDHDIFYVGIMSEMLGDSGVTVAPTTGGAVKLSTGLWVLLLAAVISVLQFMA